MSRTLSSATRGSYLVETSRASPLRLAEVTDEEFVLTPLHILVVHDASPMSWSSTSVFGDNPANKMASTSKLADTPPEIRQKTGV